MSWPGQEREREAAAALAAHLAAGLASETEAHRRAEALASKLADALERERERYHALAQSLVPKAPEPLNATVAQTFVTVASKRLDGFALRSIWAEVESLAPKAPSTPVSDEAIAHMMTRADQGIPLAIMHALDNVAPGASDPRLRAHLYQWAMQPEQRERMQTLTGLAGVVEEIVRGKQRSA